MNGRVENDIKKEAYIQKLLQDLPPYVTEWDLNLKASQKTTRTRMEYLHHIKHYILSIDNCTKLVKPDRLDLISAQKFFVSIQTKTDRDGEVKETSDSFRCVAWACLNNFFKYMVQRQYVNANPMEIIEKPKNHDLERINQSRVLLDADDFIELLWEAKHDKEIEEELKIRNYAILLLFMTTGMRQGALAEINVEDLDFDRQVITVIDKRKKTHVYPLNDNMVDALKEWLPARAVIQKATGLEADALFITMYGLRMQRFAISSMVKKYSAKALGYEISPHKLRAGYASILYHEKHDIEFVRRAMGHTDAATTARYIVTGNDEREQAVQIMHNLLH